MTLDEVKNIPMRVIVERYGFQPSRSGFIHCPFHQGDKGASMKIYAKDFHCFACSAHGSQIDFVMMMDNLSFKEAFIALGGTYDTDKEKRVEVQHKIRLAEIERQKKAEREAYMRLKKDMNNKYITALRNGLNCFPVFSDEWCTCQNELAYQLYKHEILNEPEVSP